MVQSLLIVGVGFMGGSFALALKKHGFEGSIYGLDINPESISKAKELNVIEEGILKVTDVKKLDPDMAVLASPVRTFKGIAEELKPYLRGDTIITDLGSVKGKIVLQLESILGSRFVGGHPIAGTEKSGVEHSFGELFEGKKVVLTPTTKTDKLALEKVEKLWKFVGARVEFMEPNVHDWVFGAVSHLPHAVAFALIDSLIEMSGEIDLFKYPGGGFKDFTRIAASDPVMWRDIFLANKENVIKTIDTYIKSLSKLRTLIEGEEEKALTEFLKEARSRRINLE